ncbi:hypothetical protein [Nocardia sp. NPDC019255]|uniref:hypothetical protein n=1 Tax=Nocardia sp. NPDC019255 TaxID=3154591 RepID=UPI0033F3949C
MSETQNEIKFPSHPDRDKRKPPPGYENLGGEFVTPQFKQFVQMAAEGKLPQPEDVPQLDPKVVELAQFLSVIHLPEWKNPAGRKIAEPTSMRIGGSVRLAEYLIQCGISFDPSKAIVRWVPTPGARLGAGDPGKHLWRNEDGSWPEVPDPEEFWNIDEIETQQLDDGQWAAVHPRGIQCQAATKTEAYADCVQRVAARVAELKGQQQ